MTMDRIKEFVRTRKGTVGSISLHLLVIGYGLVSFSARSLEAQPPEDIVPVDVISDAKLSEMTKGMKTGDKDEKRQMADKVADAPPTDEAIGKLDKKEIVTPTAPPEVPKKPDTPVEKKPDPKPVVQDKPQDKPKEEPKQVEKKEEQKPDLIAEQLKKDPPKPQKVEAKQEAKPQPQQQKPKDRVFDQSKIAALLDKRDPTRQAVTGDTVNHNAALGVSSGTAQKLTLSWISALKRRLQDCWNVPAGIRDGQNIEVRVYFELNPNGTLAAQPQLLAGPPSTLGPAVAESVIRAVQQCQPYSYLPQAEYKGGWDKLDITFNTDEMFRR